MFHSLCWCWPKDVKLTLAGNALFQIAAAISSWRVELAIGVFPNGSQHIVEGFKFHDSVVAFLADVSGEPTSILGSGVASSKWCFRIETTIDHSAVGLSPSSFLSLQDQPEAGRGGSADSAEYCHKPSCVIAPIQ